MASVGDIVTRKHQELRREINTAIVNHEFELHYQPIADGTRKVEGFEALLRWRHPFRGLLSPDEFVPLAEEDDQIATIGEWVLSEACHEASSWGGSIRVAVNLSPIQLRNPGFPGIVSRILCETGLPAHRLQLEVTESSAIVDIDHVNSLLQQVRSLGVKILMDDFGTGYSSLLTLHGLDIDGIKISKSFVATMTTSSKSASIVRSILLLGQSQSLHVTAEGVETDDQLQLLVSEGCPAIQGYLIGRALPIQDYGHIVYGHERPIAAAGTVASASSSAPVLRGQGNNDADDLIESTGGSGGNA